MKPAEWASVLDAIASAEGVTSYIGQDIQRLAANAAEAFRQVGEDRDAEWRAVREDALQSILRSREHAKEAQS